ncbi:hypothetical protein CPC08DRAFT_822195 [Agrocybe pediades]|nr:hypothetical protein CPC08DRAFT_822195 [Agrocybe pediades]
MSQSSETLVQGDSTAVTEVGPRLTLSLVRPNMKLDHAIIIFPETYEGAVAAALSVFRLASVSSAKPGDVELRCLVKKEARQEYYWSLIDASQWKSVINPQKDEVGVFLMEDSAQWKELGYIDSRMSLMSAPKTVAQVLYFIAEKASKKEDQRVMITPVPQNYEDCILAAYEQFNLYKIKNGCKNGQQLTLSGRISSTIGSTLCVKLTPASYTVYLSMDRGTKALEIEVSW